MAKYVDFHLVDPPKKRKTLCWTVFNKDNGSHLGHVLWFTNWRKYVFVPEAGCAFEEVCLRDIAEFIQTETRKHKKTPAEAGVDLVEAEAPILT